MKDWTGNKASTFTCLGASNHVEHDRAEHDYYATDPKAAELLLEVEPNLGNIWECACGEGHLAEVFYNAHKLAYATDIINRGYKRQEVIIDFLTNDTEKISSVYCGDIVTNPPYKFALEFVKQAISLIQDGHKVCMFLKLTFLEGKARKEFFKQYPPKTIYVCSGRVNCAKNGDFDKYTSSAVAYAWFVWQKGFTGKPTIEWIN